MNTAIPPSVSESPEARLRRMQMRANRRGIKEMDIVIGPWAEAHLAQMSEEELVLFDRLLWENDQDLMAWILGQSPTPEIYVELIERIGTFARNRARGL